MCFNREVDMYSLRVIFWELTSRSSPFKFEERHDEAIKVEILERKRENLFQARMLNIENFIKVSIKSIAEQLSICN